MVGLVGSPLLGRLNTPSIVMLLEFEITNIEADSQCSGVSRFANKKMLSSNTSRRLWRPLRASVLATHGVDEDRLRITTVLAADILSAACSTQVWSGRPNASVASRP